MLPGDDDRAQAGATDRVAPETQEPPVAATGAAGAAGTAATGAGADTAADPPPPPPEDPDADEPAL